MMGAELWFHRAAGPLAGTCTLFAVARFGFMDRGWYRVRCTLGLSWTASTAWPGDPRGGWRDAEESFWVVGCCYFCYCSIIEVVS